MSKYDFDLIIDRRGTGSIKWDCKENELPMWVADMDFKTAPEITEAFHKRVEHGVFGYSDLNNDWYESYINWWKSRHNVEWNKNWLIFSTGVIPSLSSIVRKLTTPNENVLIMTPVYNVFFNSTLNNGCNVLEVPLLYSDYKFDIDWEKLEEGLKNPQTTLMVLCNPHNPVGKIWDRDTLQRIGQMALDNGVVVVSDEIHCDLCKPGTSYVPFSSLSNDVVANSISLVAPTKTFNLAGLQTSCVVVPDAKLRHKVWRALNTDEVAEPNFLAAIAAVTAFNKGGEWLNELCSYIDSNRQYVCKALDEANLGVKVVSEDATYLLWLDISSVTTNSDNFEKYLRETTGLWITSGKHYGNCGDGFMRMNIACPHSLVIDGVNRLIEGLKSYQCNG